MRTFALAFVLALSVAACGRNPGFRVHFATASEAQLAAAEHEDVVWYEFRQGDEVPLSFDGENVDLRGGEVQIGLVRTEHGNTAGVLVFIGEQQDVPPQLEGAVGRRR